MTALPPLGGRASPFQCGRLLRWPDEASRCPNDATTHIIWTPEADNSLVCDEHRKVAQSQWSYYAMHPYRMECSLPGAFYAPAKNICIVDADPTREVEVQRGRVTADA